MNSAEQTQPEIAESRDGVSVIIGTTCIEARWKTLERALTSILSQGVPVETLVVVNGPWFSRKLFENLLARPDIKTIHLEEPGLAGAVRFGRSLVTQPFFAFLDDDDIYLPGALAARLAGIRCGDTDVLVTNGFRSDGRLYPLDAAFVNTDPLRALLKCNWLASCGALYRSATVPTDYFDGLPDIFEWTALAFRLLSEGKRIRYTNEVTYRCFDTSGSASKSCRSDRSRLERKMLEHAAAGCGRPDLAPLFRGKIRDCFHSESVFQYRNGNLREAWHSHWAGLRMGGLWQLIYTVRLLLRTVAETPRFLRRCL